MRRSGTFLLAGAAFAALACTAARAQPAAVPSSAPAAPASLLGGNGPIDVSADSQERVAAQHVVLKGNVEAIQGTARLRTPQLDIFYAQRGGGAPKAATAPGAGIGSIERMEATGPVYYVTQTQTAKGDHGTYIAAEDAIILDGDVVLTQGQNVSSGDHLVIHQKTNQAILTASGKTRTRAVIYPNQPSSPAQPGATGKAGAPKTAAAAGTPTSPRS